MSDSGHLPADIEQAALTLGQTLRDSPAVRAYRSALEAAAGDADLARLERELDSLHDALVARQMEGGYAPQGMLDEYYALEARVSNHPLRREREAALDALKASLVEVGTVISAVIGMEYTDLARPV